MDPISRYRRWDERTEPANVPSKTERVTQVAQDSEAVGLAVRVPLPGGLTPKHQEEMKEEEGRHQQEAHNTCVCDEGKGKGMC